MSVCVGSGWDGGRRVLWGAGIKEAERKRGQGERGVLRVTIPGNRSLNQSGGKAT